MLQVAQWRELYQHMEWADARVWSAVGGTGASSDARVRDTLHHLHLTQRAFLQLWQGDPRDLPDPAARMTLSAVQAWARTYYPEISVFLGTLDASRLAAPLTIPWAGVLEQRLGRPPATATLADSLLQVVLHTAHHRGQVNTWLRELGVEPPLVDFIAWVWLGKPAPEWTEPT